jgi:hypothetical protein
MDHVLDKSKDEFTLLDATEFAVRHAPDRGLAILNTNDFSGAVGKNPG